MAYCSFVLFVAFCLVVGATQNGNGGAELRPNPRILRGQVAALGQFPYQVSVRLNKEHICGGALLSRTFVVTAAHCVYNVDERELLGVQAGTVSRADGGKFSAVSNVIIHPKFGFDNDIALLELETPFEYSETIQPIAFNTWQVPVGESVVISGWGRLQEGGGLSNRLLYSRALYTLADVECAQASGSNNSTILCLYGPQGYGFCDGDDGGPAVYKNVLVGIASYQVKACGTPTKGGFTKVAAYSNWLKAIMFG
ncbi:serine protease SP24D [Zeugodacus cucurbitae]|uniref:Serine protease SP24D n=1 Tax=Zeugodacus cucurbitae TaxID=28588 RepID=A0A0A1WU11_ZEUCU|nr:serine protease SP24D [Zeugodacus cucurbitae]